MNDELKVERRVGRLLTIGVFSSLAVLLVSMAVGLWQHMPDPRLAAATQHQSLGDWMLDLSHGRGAAIAMVGLAILIATPLMRVAFSGVSFLFRRDWAMVVITSIVMGTLIVSFLLGIAH